MRISDRRTIAAVAGLTAAALIAAGCSSGAESKDVASTTSAGAVSTSVASSATAAHSSTAGAAASHSATSVASASSSAAHPGGVKVKGADGREVTLTGPIGAKYAVATEAQKKGLGAVLVGDRNAGTRDSGVVFQQFQGGAITAKNGNPGTPAYITWGKIRDAWNIERDAEGKPIAVGGTNGSAGPLGTATSDETTSGAVKESIFEHGKITYNTQTHKVEVTVNGKVVPAGL